MVSISQESAPVRSQEQNTNHWNCSTSDKTKHQVDWENTILFDSKTHWRQRKIKEALYIDSLNPGKPRSNNNMNLEKGCDIYRCWKEFCLENRKNLCSKMLNISSCAYIQDEVFIFAVFIFNLPFASLIL